MKTWSVIVGIFVALSLAAYAGAGEPDKAQEHFQKNKDSIVKNLDARIKILQKARDCASAASDHAALKRCAEQEQADNKALHEARKQEEIRQIEEQQKKLEQRKQELQSKEQKPPK